MKGRRGKGGRGEEVEGRGRRFMEGGWEEPVEGRGRGQWEEGEGRKMVERGKRLLGKLMEECSGGKGVEEGR